MAVAKPVRAVTRQGIFSVRSSVPAVKPGLVPIFRMAMVFGMREINFLPFLSLHAAKFSIGAVREFGSAV